MNKFNKYLCNEDRKLLFIEKCIEKYKDTYDYKNVSYVNSHTKVEIICKKHGIFQMRPYCHISGQGCPKCKGDKTSATQRKDINEFIKQANIIHNNVYSYDKSIYTTNKNKLIVTCPTHGDFKISPNTHLSQKIGCSKCTMSLGETRIYKILSKFGIDFKYNHQFDDCVFKKKLKFDFYLPLCNICIEYDGQQHFKHCINYFKQTKEEFEISNIRDSIKNNWCIEKNINLIRIPYNQYENIEEILYEKLNEYIDLSKSNIINGSCTIHLTYEEAKEVIKKFQIKTSVDFYKWTKSDKYISSVPKSAIRFYKNRDEWVSWSDFLSTDTLNRHEKEKLYFTYEESKKWLSENIKTNLSISLYKNLHKEGKINNKLPYSPDLFYTRQMTWSSWLDFLPNGNIATQKLKEIYKNYEESKKWLRENRPDIKTQKDFQREIKGITKISNIPASAYNKYKNSGEWISWMDFLNKLL